MEFFRIFLEERKDSTSTMVMVLSSQHKRIWASGELRFRIFSITMFLNLGCHPCLQSLFIWAIYWPLDDNVRTVLISLYILFTSVSDPWNFVMYPDPYLWPTDPDPAPDPALFVSDLQDANKKNYFLSKPTSFVAKYGKPEISCSKGKKC